MATRKRTPGTKPTPPRVGVYLTKNRESALVLRVGTHKLAYIAIQGGKVRLIVEYIETFRRDYYIFLPDYSIRKAAIGFYRDEDQAKLGRHKQFFPLTPEARKALQSVIRRLS